MSRLRRERDRRADKVKLRLELTEGECSEIHRALIEYGENHVGRRQSDYPFRDLDFIGALYAVKMAELAW